MNRLILIGNGFDLAHGLKTSYSDFIKDYFCKAVNSFYQNIPYNNILLEINPRFVGYHANINIQANTENVFNHFKEFAEQ